MEIKTPLDRVHAAMEAEDTDAARLRFYETLAVAELFLLLEAEAEGDDVVPQAFEVDGQAFVLVFDTERRLSSFAGTAADYVALSGRALVEMLADQSLGLGLNLEAAPSAMLLPPEAVTWLAQTLADAPEEVEAQAREFHPPKGLPEAFLEALDARLAATEGLADQAYLVGVTYDTGAKGHLLGFVGAMPGTEDALARSVSEVLLFSGLEAAMLDVGFFRSDDQVAARMALVGLRFDLPKVDLNITPGAAPGMDPDKPPKLR
ncbi:MAG: SseB family protein [Pseudomonadota bacterium]